MSFSDQVTEALGCYVYALEDPRIKDKVRRIFYIGKGTGNRLYNHLNGEKINGGQMPPKLELIKEIRAAGKEPEFSIIQHGLKDDAAYRLESQLITVFDGLTNLAGGHRGSDYWLSKNEIENRHDNPIHVSVFTGPVLFVSLNGNKGDNTPPYPEIAHNEATLKHRTLGDWVVTADKAKTVKYVVGCYGGLARCVYAVNKSDLDIIETKSPKGRKIRRSKWLDGKRDTSLEAKVRDRAVVDKEKEVLTKMKPQKGCNQGGL